MPDVKENTNVSERNPNLEQITMPAAVYNLDRESQQRREDNFHRAIRWMIVGWFVSILLVVGGFLMYLNQFDYVSGDCYQDVDTGENGTVTIEDGVNYTSTEG